MGIDRIARNSPDGLTDMATMAVGEFSLMYFRQRTRFESKSVRMKIAASVGESL